MRLGCGPCAEEQAFLSRRKQLVARALKQALQLDDDLQEDEVCGPCVLGRLGGRRDEGLFLQQSGALPTSCVPAPAVLPCQRSRASHWAPGAVNRFPSPCFFILGLVQVLGLGSNLSSQWDMQPEGCLWAWGNPWRLTSAWGNSFQEGKGWLCGRLLRWLWGFQKVVTRLLRG